MLLYEPEVVLVGPDDPLPVLARLAARLAPFQELFGQPRRLPACERCAGSMPAVPWAAGPAGRPPRPASPDAASCLGRLLGWLLVNSLLGLLLERLLGRLLLIWLFLIRLRVWLRLQLLDRLLTRCRAATDGNIGSLVSRASCPSPDRFHLLHYGTLRPLSLPALVYVRT